MTSMMMRTGMVLLVLAVLTLGPVGRSIADPGRQTVARSCHGDGDQTDACVLVQRVSGRTKLVFINIAVSLPYRLCVESPAGKSECHRFRTREKKPGAFGSQVDFDRNFEHSEPGRYTARWIVEGGRSDGGRQIGKRLHFSAP